MTSDVIIKIPLVNQHADTGHVYWAPRTCALCSLKMIMTIQNPELADISVMELIDKALSSGPYDERVGWRHQVLVDVARLYGVQIDYLRLFKKTKEEKEDGLEFISQKLEEGNPVIVSLYYKLDPANGGHMVVVQGIKREILGKVKGLFIQDPDGSFQGHNYFLPREVFLANWRGGMLWLKEWVKEEI